MDPIQAISELTSGDVVHHPALGFAVVDRVDDAAASLDWEHPGARLPPIVSAELLAKGYRRCTPGGFMQQSVLSRDQLELVCQEQPAHAVRMLADELGESIGRAEIHDWMTGRELISSTQFDRWWSRLEEAVSGEPGLSWAKDHNTITLVGLEGEVDSESFLSSPPRLRWKIATEASPDTLTRLLLQAITARDTPAIIVLLRVHDEVPDKARKALRKLALGGNHDVTAALLAHGDAHVLSKLVVPAGRSGRRAEVDAVLSRLPPSTRRGVAAKIIEEALTIEGNPPAATWLISQVHGGAQGILDAAFERGDCPRAVAWLKDNVSAEFIDADTINEELQGLLESDTLITNHTVDLDGPTRPLLAQLRDLPLKDLFRISSGLARALALRHAQGDRGGITGARLDQDGSVELGPMENTSPRSDVRDAMRLVLEMAVGPLPNERTVQDDHLLGHAHILRPELSADWMAVAAKAMAAEPEMRHTDGIDLWAHLARAEANHQVRSQTPNHPHQRIRVAHDTHIGLMKSRLMQTNQDAVFYAQTAHLSLLLVCDGISVSTAGSGNLASALCVKAVAGKWEKDLEMLLTADEDAVKAWLGDTLVDANAAICASSEELAEGHLEQHIPMGTTAVLALVSGNTVQLASLGDSRAYLIGSSGVSLLTGDQNVRSLWLTAAKRGERFEMGDEGYALAGYCGRFDEHLKPFPAEPVYSKLQMLPEEVLLMCSDGLTDYAGQSMAETSQIIAQAAECGDLNQGCRNLVEAANVAGGGDNITVLLARLQSR